MELLPTELSTSCLELISVWARRRVYSDAVVYIDADLEHINCFLRVLELVFVLVFACPMHTMSSRFKCFRYMF